MISLFKSYEQFASGTIVRVFVLCSKMLLMFQHCKILVFVGEKVKLLRAEGIWGTPSVPSDLPMHLPSQTLICGITLCLMYRWCSL